MQQHTRRQQNAEILNSILEHEASTKAYSAALHAFNHYYSVILDRAIEGQPIYDRMHTALEGFAIDLYDARTRLYAADELAEVITAATV